MPNNVDREITRRPERNSRLLDMEDPYRPIHRGRSPPFDFPQRTERRSRNIDLDVREDTDDNYRTLVYPSQPRSSMNRTRSGNQRHSGGYTTDVQPSTLRGSSTSAGQPNHLGPVLRPREAGSIAEANSL